MKYFHQNVLIFLALCLCGLCAYQWYVQSMQRGAIEKLEQCVAERNAGLLAATNTIKTSDHQIAQLDARITEYKHAAQTNEQVIATQQHVILNLQATGCRQTAQLDEYAKAVEGLRLKLKDAYDGIKRQNEATQELIAQRDALVVKYNTGIEERNAVVAKYNDLVRQLEKQAAAAQAGPRAGGGSGP